MSLVVKQEYEYQEGDWWKWSVWVDGPKEDLDRIDHVTYLLHPTFPGPVRTMKNRRTKFRLRAYGQGGLPPGRGWCLEGRGDDPD